ncbi:proteasome subunit beta type-4 [Ischnura elegans]|uniref:proteasome subunit beta type-4 n=1 Tax=Ischnura elegans TaxID=197161 RepID=UPI001ED8A7F1|nr:proteasome subunit beta type-4 [Ischnura elegans]
MALPTEAGKFISLPFWQNGPSPGAFYNFPNVQPTPDTNTFQRSKAPITTATSVLGVMYNGGVAIAADILGSYGSLARFRDCPRVMKVNNNIILGAGGDYADFQYLRDIIEQKIIDEECLDDGFALKPKSLYCWLTRVLYNRRSRFDPFWNNFIVAGIQDGQPFLGTVDKLGTAFEDKHIATGYGAYMALPLLRNAVEEKGDLGLSRDEAKALLVRCLEILFYRDARSFPKYHIATVDIADGVIVEGPLELKSNWEVAHMIKGYE